MDVDEPCAVVPLVQAGDPSAFVPVAGEPAVARVVRSLLGAVAPGRLVVAVAPALYDAVCDCLRSADLASVAVTTAREPGSRRQAIIAGLEHLAVEPNSSMAVLVGDHRNPLSSDEVARRVLARLRDGHQVAVPTLAVTDTVKIVDGLGSVVRTVDRTALRTVQYPRAFVAAALWNLLSDSTIDHDDGGEFESAMRAGLAIGTVDGHPHAFQVELPRDAPLLAAITGST